VVATCAIVVAIAVVLVYLTQSVLVLRPLDTTASGILSLREQSRKVLGDLKQTVRLVSVYAPVKKKTAEDLDRPQMIRDLLEEYARHSGQIKVQSIDKVSDAAKVEALIDEVKGQYGGDEKAYRDYLTKDFPVAFNSMKAFVEGELPKLQERLAKVTDMQTLMNLAILQSVLSEIPQALGSANKRIAQTLAEPLPNYKDAVDDIKKNMNQISSNFGDLVEFFRKNKDEKSVPADLRQYMGAAIEGYEATRKLADEQTQKMDKLGSVDKLDELRKSLRTEETRARDEKPQDAILVMGQKDMRVLWASQLWQEPERRDVMTGDAKPRFAGEQRITGAIIALTQPKPIKVAFLKPGGVGPLTSPAVPGFRRAGPLALIAQRMKNYNMEVLEKDMSKWDGPDMNPNQPPQGPDATDEQIKDAVWVVLNLNPMAITPTATTKIDEHLKSGGGVMVLFGQDGDPMASLLSRYGIEAKPKATIIHQMMELPEGREGDWWEQFYRRNPYFHILNQYGDHAMTKSLGALTYALHEAVPITKTSASKATLLLPLPSSPAAWGETDKESIENGEEKFDKDKGDVPAPLYAGAAAEGDQSSRLVVLGSIYIPIQDLLAATERGMGGSVSRFPGNGELFTNAIFWLAKNESMIAISPSAMEVARIEPMDKGTRQFWTIGVLLIGLPLLVVVAGVLVYLKRRD
jgi:predicted house-cleaning noncanonical NTP pyrophosphatase (MazG superfamily)